MQQVTGPKALTDYILNLSKSKEAKSNLNLLIQGILAGGYIAIGAIGYFKLAANIADPGLAAFLASLVFPLGIIAILKLQSELFTSGCLIMTSFYAGETKLHKIFKILIKVILANLIGAIFIAILTNASGVFDEQTMGLVIEKAFFKVHMPFGKLLVSGILCNIIVCTAMCMAYSSRDEISKIVLLWLAITVFALSGTEHVVANMYYLFTAYFAGAEISILEILYNLSVSAIGNFIGGGIIVAGANYIVTKTS